MKSNSDDELRGFDLEELQPSLECNHLRQISRRVVPLSSRHPPLRMEHGDQSVIAECDCTDVQRRPVLVEIDLARCRIEPIDRIAGRGEDRVALRQNLRNAWSVD